MDMEMSMTSKQTQQPYSAAANLEARLMSAFEDAIGDVVQYQVSPDHLTGVAISVIAPVIARLERKAAKSTEQLICDNEAKNDAYLVRKMLEASAETMHWEDGMRLALKAIRPYLRAPEPVSSDEDAHADMLAEELIALANEGEGHAVICKSGELMNACARANKSWLIHVERRRRKHVD